MVKLKMLMWMLFLLVLVGMFSACTSDDENLAALNEEVAMVKTATTAKEQFRNDLQDAFSNVKHGEKPKLTLEQVNLLQESAKNMLKAEGVYTAECKKLEQENKAGLILVGSLYLGMTTQHNGNARILKTRSSESTTCYDWNKFISCLKTALSEYVGVGMVEGIIKGIVAGECLTRTMIVRVASEVAGTVLKRVAPGVIGIGIDFTVEVTYSTLSCMGIFHF